MAIAAELKEARRRRREAALALRPEMSPTGPASDQLRVATWKASEVAPVAAGLFDELGYHVVHSGAGAYNGVAIAARHPMSDVVVSADLGDEFLGREPQVIAA